MPDYALQHVFSRYGGVDFVRLQSDARHGVVQFATAEAAAAALAGLTGTDICGQVRILTLPPGRHASFCMHSAVQDTIIPQH